MYGYVDARGGGEKQKQVFNKLVTKAIYVPHTVSDMEPDERVNMSAFDAFELTHAAPHSVCWKELASSNIPSIFSTRDTSQLDRSWLKE